MILEVAAMNSSSVMTRESSGNTVLNLEWHGSLELFELSDPITHEEIRALESYFRHELGSLFEAVKKEKPRTLIGASGSFDTFYAMIRLRAGVVADMGKETPIHDRFQAHPPATYAFHPCRTNEYARHGSR